MVNRPAHRNDPRPRLGKCARELLTGHISRDTLPGLLESCRTLYEKEIPKIPELHNTLLVRPELLEKFSFVNPDGSIRLEDPTVEAAIELQESAQCILAAYSQFRSMAIEELKRDPKWRKEYLSDVEPKFDRLMCHERFRLKLVTHDTTGEEDWELICIIDLYGLNDLVEYSLVNLALEPKLIQTECLIPAEDSLIEAKDSSEESGSNSLPSEEVIFGRCHHCHQYYVRNRVDQTYCSASCRKGGLVPEEWDLEVAVR